jgi:hypothetical protein
MDAEAALAAFDESGAEELPYVDEGGRFSGFIERAALLAAYRRVLKALTLGGD